MWWATRKEENKQVWCVQEVRKRMAISRVSIVTKTRGHSGDTFKYIACAGDRHVYIEEHPYQERFESEIIAHVEALYEFIQKQSRAYHQQEVVVWDWRQLVYQPCRGLTHGEAAYFGFFIQIMKVVEKKRRKGKGYRAWESAWRAH